MPTLGRFYGDLLIAGFTVLLPFPLCLLLLVHSCSSKCLFISASGGVPIPRLAWPLTILNSSVSPS